MRLRGLWLRRGGVALAAALAAGVGLAGPASANIDAASGDIFGTVSIASPGIQSALSLNCNAISWGFSQTGPQLGVAATTGEGFVGDFNFSAGGNSSSCESVDVGFGGVTVSVVTGANLDPAVFHMTLSCSQAGGSYNRLGSIVLLSVPSAACTVDTPPVQNVAIVAAGQLTPTTGNGVNTPITQANFTGVWSVANPNN
jgi:hypothetical protein